ncbi:MAG: stalk domain-containing protein [Tissierellia bacterium]|nr:stalk domain-containing protein [Tissierellia bacterium]
MKKYFILLLVLTMLFPSFTWAEEVKKENKDFGYRKIVGEIKEVEDHGFLIKDDQEEIIILYGGSKVLDLKTGEFVEEKTFEVGQEVLVFIRNNTPVLKSLPPQVNPQLIAIHPRENYNVEMDFFKEDGESLENRLTIVGTENTKIFDLNGKEKKGEDIKNQELIVLYKISTRSIPPQTNPEKIFIWKDIKAELTEEDFQHPFLFGKAQKGFGLRTIFESLGVKVTWNNDTREIGLIQREKEGVISTKDKKFTLGEQSMALDFFEIKDGTSYLTRETIEKIWEGLR